MPSNAGFRPQELQRRQFQQAVVETLDRQAHAITTTREFMADLSARVDAIKSELAAVIDQAGWAVAQCKDHDRAQDGLKFQAGENDRMFGELYALVKRGFLGRLRWVFLGK